jgi:hypothetical protein
MIKKILVSIYSILTMPIIGGIEVSDMECKCGSCKLKREFYRGN